MSDWNETIQKLNKQSAETPVTTPQEYDEMVKRHSVVYPYDSERTELGRATVAAITALRAERDAAVEALRPGYVMVPEKPTEAMIEAARMTLPGPVDICDADIEDIYETMLEAASLASRKEEV